MHELRIGDPLEWAVDDYAFVAESGLYMKVGYDAALGVAPVLAAASGGYDVTGSVATLQTQNPGEWRGNEPDGMNELTDRQFTTVTETGWWTSPNDAGFFIDDAHSSAPSGDDTVGVAPLPEGWPSGGAFFVQGINTPDATELYVCFYHKFSSNWSSHTTGLTKVLISSNDMGEPGSPFVLMATGPAGVGGGTQSYRLYWQGLRNTSKSEEFGRGIMPANGVSNGSVTPGDWALIEYHFIMNSSDTAFDGEAWLWVDGDLVTYLDDISFSDAGQSWTGGSTKINFQRGGTGGSAPEDMWHYIDRMYVSTK